jgi:Ca2+-binding RTX toxin-like protein
MTIDSLEAQTLEAQTLEAQHNLFQSDIPHDEVFVLAGIYPGLDSDDLSQEIMPPVFGVVVVDEMPTIVDNLINGTPEADRLRGEDGTNSILGFAGDDTLFGGSQLDVLSGDEGDDVLRGGDGDDRLNGGDGNDRLLGGGNRDNLEGGRGNDRLRGGLGRDILRGDEGRDVLIGGRASDVFILQSDLGSDRIEDFTVGQDKLGLADTFGVGDLSIRQVGNNTAIFKGTDRLAILVGVDADSITTNDFTRVIFAL